VKSKWIEHKGQKILYAAYTPGTPEIMNALYTSAKACKPHMIATAVVGVGTIRMMLLRSVTRVTGMPLTAIETLDEAKDWLANQ